MIVGLIVCMYIYSLGSRLPSIVESILGMRQLVYDSHMTIVEAAMSFRDLMSIYNHGIWCYEPVVYMFFFICGERSI